MQTFRLRGTVCEEDWVGALPHFSISSGDSKRFVLPPPGVQRQAATLRQPQMWTLKSSSIPLPAGPQQQSPSRTEPVTIESERSPTPVRVLVPMATSTPKEEDEEVTFMEEDLSGKNGGLNKMYEERWEEMYEQLKEFKARYGHCNVRQRYKNSQLGHWVNSMRGRKKAGELSEDRIHKLEELGFIWQYRKEAWLNSYEELAKFKEIYGHCNVPTSWEQNPKLGRWLQYMRKKKCGGKLSAEQVQKLEDLGVEWRPSSTSSSNLKADSMDTTNHSNHSSSDSDDHTRFSDDGGNSALQEGDDGSNNDVPSMLQTARQAEKHVTPVDDSSSAAEDPSSMDDYDDENQSATSQQPAIDPMECLTSAAAHAKTASAEECDRRLRKRKQPTPGPTASPSKSAAATPSSWPRPTWYQRYEQLKQFKARFGHCKVPYRWGENPGLGRWVSLMRKKRKESKLEDHKEKMLNELSFAWSLVGYRTRLDKRGRDDDRVVEDKMVSAAPQLRSSSQRNGWKFVDEGENVEFELSMPPKKRRRMLDASDSSSPIVSPRSSSAENSFDSDSEASAMEQDEEAKESVDCVDGFSLILRAAELLNPKTNGTQDGNAHREPMAAV